MKKDAFSWTTEATQAFEKPKDAMCKAPILTTLDFKKPYIMEFDALGNGIDVVLMLEGKHLSFESRSIKENNLHKPIYEKEMLAILHALKKWSPNLIGRHSRSKQVMIVLNASWNRDYIHKSNTNG